MRLGAFGPGSEIGSPVMVTGHESIRIGARVAIWGYGRLEAFETGRGTERIVIGDGTKIQPHVHIAAARSVRIGAEVLMASHVYITDHDHDYSDPASPVVSNNRLVVDPVTIEDRVWLGERVMVLKGVTIGESSIVGAGSIVTKDVPPFSIAVGAPARIISRYDEAQGRWVREPRR
jgi:lipopolysaccharide O-acetyltransferase